MKRFVSIGLILLGFIMFEFNHANAVCTPPIYLCSDTLIHYTASAPPEYWFSINVPIGYTGPIFQLVQCIPAVNIKVIGRYSEAVPCFIPDTAACDSFTQITNLTVSTLHGSGTGAYYYIRIVSTGNVGVIDFRYRVTPSPCEVYPTEVPCKDCLPSFAPQPDSSYIISAWVKEANAPVTTTTYTNAYIEITYTGGSSPGQFKGKGQIIDGWQRIEESFTIPHAATQIQINLHCGSATAYFDDVRVFPAKGTMKSYVFDPLTLRLAAELDERNYATIYEYDEEGKLLRVKKETERGIMTIQENKNNTSKTQ